ncbi:MAG: hypothetical protein C5B50_23745 [Verrucomicrobia bacterium]|nr:MAG: hypothetical protein C5B50_23745 [Verrucomicrobiota bacterium]
MKLESSYLSAGRPKEPFLRGGGESWDKAAFWAFWMRSASLAGRLWPGLGGQRQVSSVKCQVSCLKCQVNRSKVQRPRSKRPKFKVQSSKSKVQGSKFKVQSSRFKVQGSSGKGSTEFSMTKGQRKAKPRNWRLARTTPLLPSRGLG